MGNSIKDIINTFKNDLDEVITPPAKKETSKGTKQKTSTVKAQTQPKETKIQTPEALPEKKEEVTEDKAAQKRGLNQAFFDTLSNLEFSFEDRKTTFIDGDLYEILVMLKHKKKIKSVAILFNAIVKQFVEDNKKDIQKILANNKL